MDPIVWLLVGSVFVFIGSSRQAWFELRDWQRRLESTLVLALELVEEDQRLTLASELESLSGARRVAKKRQLNRLARKELQRRGQELLSPEEHALLEVSTRGAVSWAFIVLGSAITALDPILELFFR